MIKRIFLDMDGVLCNFVDATARLFKTTEEELLRKWEPGVYDICLPLGITTEQLWYAIGTNVHTHWPNLKPYPWAKELWELCNKYAPTIILSSPSYDPGCLSGKNIWLNEHLADGEPFRKFLIGPAKEFCAAEEHLLIDDSDAQCEKFKENGGHAITFPQIWNCLHHQIDRRMNLVELAIRHLTQNE